TIQDTAAFNRLPATVRSTALIGAAPPPPPVNVGNLGSFLIQSLNTLQSNLDTNAFTNAVPLIGGQLAGTRAAHVMTTLGTALGSRFAAFDVTQASGLQLALFQALGPNGLNVLLDVDANGKLDFNDIGTLGNGPAITFTVHLRLSKQANSSRVGFQTGLPGVPLQ